MSELFGKILTYVEPPPPTSICSACPHLHRPNELGPSTARAYVCVPVYCNFEMFMSERGKPETKKREPEATSDTARERVHNQRQKAASFTGNLEDKAPFLCSQLV